MPAVTQLPRTVADQLAEVSGAPRPVLPASPRAASAGQVPVVGLRPTADPHGEPRPAAPAVPDEGPVPDGEARRDDGASAGPGLDGGQADADRESSRRISGIARSVAQGALEVLGGSRPLQQLSRWLDAENYERLQLRANLVRCIGDARAGRRGDATTSAHRHVVVRSARVCAVSPGVYEASVVAYDQKRVRAVALRIEQRRGAWRVTALEIG